VGKYTLAGLVITTSRPAASMVVWSLLAMNTQSAKSFAAAQLLWRFPGFRVAESPGEERRPDDLTT
jgi:hypothetical protein